MVLQRVSVPKKAPTKAPTEARKLRTLMWFLLGVEGKPEGVAMPQDVFPVVLDLLMPLWNPLQRKPGAGSSLPLRRVEFENTPK